MHFNRLSFMFARCLYNKVSYPDVCPQTRWSRAAAGCWCTARRGSPAPPPSAWPISCTRGASGWTRPSISWSSGAKSSRPTWPSWGSCCSSRPTCCARAEAPGAEQEGSTRGYKSPALVCSWAFSGLHDSSAHYLLWVKHIWCVSSAQHFATWTVKKNKKNCSVQPLWGKPPDVLYLGRVVPVLLFFVFVLTCVSDPLQGLSLFQYHIFLVATTVTPFYDSNTVWTPGSAG